MTWLGRFSLNQRAVFVLFGIYDLLCIIWYCTLQILWGGVPYWTGKELLVDFISGPSPMQLGWFVHLWLLICYLSNLSIIVSCVLFFMNSRLVKHVVYFQLPLRGLLLIVLLMVVFPAVNKSHWNMGLIALPILLFFVVVEIYRWVYIWDLKRG